MPIATVAEIVLPVFGLILLGWVAGRLRWFGEGVGEALGEFVFQLPIPVLMFRTIGTAHLPEGSPIPLWLSYFAGAGLVWALAQMMTTRLAGRSHGEGVIAGLSASFSNLLVIGVPLLTTAYGEAGVVVLFVIVSIHLPIMMTAGTLMTEHAVRRDAGDATPLSIGRLLGRIVKNLATSPIVIAVFAGGLWRISGLEFGPVAKGMIDGLAASATPLALVSMGMGLARYSLRGALPLALMSSTLKLAVMPLAVWVLTAKVAHLPELWVNVATISAAAPSGANSYLFAVRFRVGHALASSAIALSTLMAVVTITLWLAILPH
ncbi:AEC family transporter [Methyloraptor flagellatus]|uniref:AEC family transporter n=1 Tax=Methyloraptor flagellatus TaxID=3162530 RepID=A0AAU7XBP8_9HYPH